jgi:hypothetical protein
MTEPQVYITPNIREQAIETIRARAEQRRTRRMLVAMEVNQLKAAKLQKASEKDNDKFNKVIERAQKRLDQVRELLDKADDDLKEATGLHNRMVLFERELGQ